MRIEDTPGYIDAVRRECLERDAAFLGVTDSICGFEVVQMTLRQWSKLRLSRNPLLAGGTPSPSQLAMFLWVISPKFRQDGCGLARHLRACRRRFVVPSPPLFRTRLAMRRWAHKTVARLSAGAEVVKGCREYLEATFMDEPLGVGGTVGHFQAPKYSEMAYYVGAVASKFPQPDDVILDKPVKAVFQLLRLIDQMNGGDVPVVNRLSDGVLNAWLAEQNSRKGRTN